MPHAELVGPFPEGADVVEYDQIRRRLLWSMPSGLYLLASREGERRNLMALSLVTQLATDPKLLGVAIEKEALSHELVRGAGVFGLVLLGREQRGVIRKFVKPAAHDLAARTLSGYPYRDGPRTGVPIPHFAAGALECRLRQVVELGSHDFFIGEVVDAAAFDPGGLEEPLRMQDTRLSYGG